MSITCEGCRAILSDSAMKCPKCWYPTPRNQGQCRICSNVLAVSEHVYTAYSNHVINGNSSSSSYIRHVPCNSCGEPMPLWQPPNFKKFFKTIFLIICFSLLLAIVGIVLDKFSDTNQMKNTTTEGVDSTSTVDLSGKWEGTFTYPDGVKTKLKMTITSTHGKLSGSMSEADPKTNQPANSTLSGLIFKHNTITFTQTFGTTYQPAHCHAIYDEKSKNMSGKCSAGVQSANLTAKLM